jgi:hypothetical protein
VSPHVRSVLAVLGALVVIGCVVGLVSTWPSDPIEAAEGYAIDRVEATVVSLEVCEGGEGECLQAVAELEDGTEVVVQVPSSSSAASVDVGQAVVLGYSEELPAGNQYSFLEADRSTPVVALVVVFAVAVLLLSGWRGAASLLSLALTLLVIVIYVLPALRDDSSPLLVALITAGVVMLVTMYASYGISVRSTVALVGTLLGLALAALVGRVVTAAASFTGLDETTRFLETLVGSVDTRGLLLAGPDHRRPRRARRRHRDPDRHRVGARGRRPGGAPALPVRRRHAGRAGPRVGDRQHPGARVRGRLAAAAALHLRSGHLVDDAVFSESVATEIVRGLAGSLGIVAAVPLTTALACWAVPRPISSPR